MPDPNRPFLQAMRALIDQVTRIANTMDQLTLAPPVADEAVAPHAGRARLSVNEITSDQLDALYQRAEQAEAAIDEVKAMAADIDTPDWHAPGTEVAARIRAALNSPAAAADDTTEH